MTSDSNRFNQFQSALFELLWETNKKLDKLISLTVSQQLLNECISPEGEVRTAEECADIVNESYFAGLCLNEELTERTKQFEYQKSEFFVRNDSLPTEGGDDDLDGHSELIPRIPTRF